MCVRHSCEASPTQTIRTTNNRLCAGCVCHNPRRMRVHEACDAAAPLSLPVTWDWATLPSPLVQVARTTPTLRPPTPPTTRPSDPIPAAAFTAVAAFRCPKYRERRIASHTQPCVFLSNTFPATRPPKPTYTNTHTYTHLYSPAHTLTHTHLHTHAHAHTRPPTCGPPTMRAAVRSLSPSASLRRLVVRRPACSADHSELSWRT